MIRIDLFLKKYCIDQIKLNEKIYFAHIDSNMNIEISNKSNRFGICQQIMIFPKKFFNIFTKKIIYNFTHEIKDEIKNEFYNKNISYLENGLYIYNFYTKPALFKRKQDTFNDKFITIKPFKLLSPLYTDPEKKIYYNFYFNKREQYIIVINIIVFNLSDYTNYF